jgi:hypothetical protein
MPHHLDDALLRAMGFTELSRVRTKLHRRRIFTTTPPHPVQPNPQPASHRYLGNASVSTHRQMHVPTFPVWMNARCRLGFLHQQEPQQGTARLGNVSQSLLASTGVLTRDHPYVRADLLAAWKPSRSSDDQHEASAVIGPTPG